jgi:hypothetical protein
MRKLYLLAAVLALTLGLTLHSAQLTISVGSTANDGTGDSLRSAFQKVNTNFTTLFDVVLTNGSVYSSTGGQSGSLSLYDPGVGSDLIWGLQSSNANMRLQFNDTNDHLGINWGGTARSAFALMIDDYGSAALELRGHEDLDSLESYSNYCRLQRTYYDWVFGTYNGSFRLSSYSNITMRARNGGQFHVQLTNDPSYSELAIYKSGMQTWLGLRGQQAVDGSDATRAFLIKVDTNGTAMSDPVELRLNSPDVSIDANLNVSSNIVHAGSTGIDATIDVLTSSSSTNRLVFSGGILISNIVDYAP